MKTVVFFKHQEYLHDALSYFPLQQFKGKEVLLKLHMGEKNNSYFIKPQFVKHVVDEIKTTSCSPFLFDTTVAYHGPRYTKKGYLRLAASHGFSKEHIGCDIIIDDTGVPITIQGRTYEVACRLHQTTHVFALSHVKGHIQTGVGGAIKNFGMGGVTKKTKLKIHQGSRPILKKDACTYCGLCAEVCPFQAIKVKEKSWEHDKRMCFGCGVCVDACKSNALRNIDADIQYLLACSAQACLKDKTVIYLNELKRIAKGCDCDPAAGPIICPDIGYLLSDDPVAIDKASLDLIDEVKKDIFKKVNKVDPLKQIRYAEEIGLGSSYYELIKI